MAKFFGMGFSKIFCSRKGFFNDTSLLAIPICICMQHPNTHVVVWLVMCAIACVTSSDSRILSYLSLIPWNVMFILIVMHYNILTVQFPIYHTIHAINVMQIEIDYRLR